MKKVAVIPYSDYEKMRVNNQIPITQPQPTAIYEPKIEQMTGIEKELTEILNSRMNIHEKRIKYQEILQKLIDLKEKYFDDNVSRAGSDQVEGVKDFKTILETILPISVKNKGLALYNTLKGQIDWNNDGQLVIDGKPIPGSNIVDLVDDLVRNTKRNPITGWSVIKQELKTINLPKSLILNQKRSEDLENVHSTPSVIDPITPLSTPLGFQTKRKRKSTAAKKSKKAGLAGNWLKM